MNEFRKAPLCKGGRGTYCKPCAALISKEWRKKNPGKVEEMRAAHKLKDPEASKRYYRNYAKDGKAKDRQLKRYYGIGLDEFNKMLTDQNRQCKICSAEHEDLTKGLVVDHCHATKKIRGLLCQPCNLLLGAAKDDRDVLEKAIRYLL